MKLSIFGRHPIPQGGFNGVMSLFEAIEFSRLGYETTLLIPFSDRVQMLELLRANKVSSLDELPRFGGKFDIIPVFPDGENFNECDVLIYQSYDQKDWEDFSNICVKKARIFTKNFPKFVPSPEGSLHVENQLMCFDLVACALKEDYELIFSNKKYREEYGGRFAYVPRGASPELLHAGYKLGIPPTLGFDVPNVENIKALEHYIEPVKRLRRDFPELRVLTIGRAVAELSSERIPFGRFDKIYENFFNNIHVYGTINYEHSPAHTTAAVQATALGWKRKAIYEVQNIEAQMSGAVLYGHRDNIISELYIPGLTGINFTDFGKEDEIYRSLKLALAGWQHHGLSARRFAEENFSWSRCIKLWSDAIQRSIEVKS
jgi:glycosyltransferase involved in cell wall biosynthesis